MISDDKQISAEPALSFSIFSPGEKQHGHQVAGTWSKLRQLLTRGSKETVKERMGGWAPVRLRGHLRQETHVEHVSCLVLDIDNKKGKERVPDDELTTIEGTLRALNGHQLLIYTSFSHTELWPRFRVVIPFDLPLSGTDYADCWAGAVNWLAGLGIAVDTQTKDPSRLWYLSPRTKVKSELREGKPLDTAPLIAAHRAEIARVRKLVGKRTSGELAERVAKYLDKCPPAVEGQEGHKTAWNVVRAVVRGFDLGEEEALSHLQGWNNRCEPPWPNKDLLHKIKQARSSGTTPDIGAFVRDDKKRREKHVPSDLKIALMGGATLEETAELVGITIDNGDNEPQGLESLDSAKTSHAPENDSVEPSQLTRVRRNLTDLGNAERLIDRHGADLKFVEAWGKWIIWDGCRWVLDPRALRVRGLAAETVRAIYGEALLSNDRDEKARIVAHAQSSEATPRISNMIDEAKRLVSVDHSALDADPYVLNVLNGTLNLKTGLLGTHQREDLITKLAPVRYDRKADRTLFEGCLATSQPDPEVRSFLMRSWGYSLTGDVGEHVFWVHYGPKGRNGKGTLMNSIARVLGDYAAAAVPDDVMIDTPGAHPTGLTQLAGRRFCITSETERAKRIRVALVKRLTGGDVITARKMREDFWEFRPTHKLHVPTNHKPSIPEGPEDPIWDRVMLVPWTIKIPPEQRIKNLDVRLATEGAEGLLAALVDGCLEWQRVGLQPPLAVRAAVEEYQDESDTLAEFIDECLVFEEGASVAVGTLYETYRRWAESQGLTSPLTKRRLQQALGEREVGVSAKDRSSTAVRTGIRIATMADRPGHASAHRDAVEALDAAFGADLTNALDDLDVGDV